MSKIINNAFNEIVVLIKQSRIKAVNAELVKSTEWGKSVVVELAKYIQQQEPNTKGFSDKNLWRMKQFYETYIDTPKLSTLLRQISWWHNLTIFSRCKTIEEREFYLTLSQRENYSFRELNRQISTSLSPTMVSEYKIQLPNKTLL